MMHQAFLTRRALVAASLLVAVGVAASPAVAQSVVSGAPKSAKERLSDKASDEQRVDYCHVAPERRGIKQRPDCPAPQDARKPTAEASAKGQ